MGIHIVHKPGPDLYIEDWLSQNKHTENRDQEIKAIDINVHAISTLVSVLICTSIEHIQVAT